MAKLSGSFGEVLTLAPSTECNSGNFCIIGRLVGVAAQDMEDNEYGAVFRKGVVSMPKTAASVAVTLGAKLYSLHNSNTVNTTSASRNLVGYAVSESAASSNDPVDVLLAAKT